MVTSRRKCGEVDEEATTDLGLRVFGSAAVFGYEVQRMGGWETIGVPRGGIKMRVAVMTIASCHDTTVR